MGCHTPYMTNIEIPTRVGDPITYSGKTITTVAKVEPYGLNRKVTYANGYVVIVPGRD